MDSYIASANLSPDQFDNGWRKFEKGSPPKILRDVLLRNAPEWSNALELPNKLKKGDVYLYLGGSVEPSCAIRIFDGLVDEVLSTADSWEKHSGASRIIDELVRGLPGYERFKEAKADLITFNSIESKIQDSKNRYAELSGAELTFLYELDRNIRFFGQSRDYRLHNILAKRDRYSDMATIFGCLKEEVTFLKSDINENIRVYCGVLDSRDWEILADRKSRLMIVGDVVLDNCRNIERIPDGLHIYGRASFRNCPGLKEIGNYVVFRGDANFTGNRALAKFGYGIEFLGKANLSECSLLSDYPVHVIFASGIDFSGTSIRSIPSGSLFLEKVNFARTAIQCIPRDVEFCDGADFEESALEYIADNVVFKAKVNFKKCLQLKDFHPSVKFLGAASFESSGIRNIPESMQFFDDVDFSSCSNLSRVSRSSRFYGVARFSNSGVEKVEDDVKFYGPVMLKSCSKFSTIGEGVSFQGPVYIKNCPAFKK